jgi:hypothetical protein
MIYILTFLVSFLSAQNSTQATEGAVFTKCEDTAIPGTICTQKYQTNNKLTDEVKLPESNSKDQNASRGQQ